METLVYQGKAKWDRPAYIKIIDDKVVFDCSDEEYGPIKFNLELLEEAISNHKFKQTLKSEK